MRSSVDDHGTWMAIAPLLRVALSGMFRCLLLFVKLTSLGEMSDAFAEGSSSAKAQHIGQAIVPS